jgi:RHS repeat-associated protein
VEAPIKLTSSGPIGAAKLMKVMAGDRIHTAVDYYFTTEEGDNSNANPLNTVVTGIVASITNSIGMGIFADHTSTVSSQLQGNSSLSNLVNTAANIPPQNIFGPPYAPQAFLCVLFFDERFQFDAASSYIEMVAWGANSKKRIDRTFGNALTAGKNGYVYVYFANESNTNVYFDNFYLSHERGPILEETHYYPFGLTMAGISTRALGFGTPENKKNKFQNQEFNDDLGVNGYEFKYRMHDPQIGRFWQVDPLANDYVYNSTYAFSENQVTSHVELEGLEKAPIKYYPPNSPMSVFDSEIRSTKKPQHLVETQVPITIERPKKEKQPGLSFTGVVTLGTQLALDLEVEGCPVSGGVNLNSGSGDVLGVRDSKAVVFGNQVNGDKYGVLRKGAEINLLGFGASTEVEKSISKSTGETTIERIDSKLTPFTKTEQKVQKNGVVETPKNYFTIGFKIAFFVGIEAEIKIPAGNNSASTQSTLRGSPVDNTRLQTTLPIIK